MTVSIWEYVHESVLISDLFRIIHCYYTTVLLMSINSGCFLKIFWVYLKSWWIPWDFLQTRAYHTETVRIWLFALLIICVSYLSLSWQSWLGFPGLCKRRESPHPRFLSLLASIVNGIVFSQTRLFSVCSFPSQNNQCLYEEELGFIIRFVSLCRDTICFQMHTLLSCVMLTDKWMLKRLCGLNWADCPESFQCALGFASSFSFCCVFGLVIKDILTPECIMKRILFYPISWVIRKFSLRQLQVYGVEWTLLVWPLLWEAFYYHWDAQSLLQNFLSFISILLWDFSIYKNSFLESHFSVSSVCWINFLCSIYILLILELF